MMTIARVEAAIRAELVQQGTLDARFAIRCAGLERGYARLAEQHRRSEAWWSAALAHAKAAGIARLTQRPAAHQLCESAEAWLRAGDSNRAMTRLIQAGALLDESGATRRGAGKSSAGANGGLRAKTISLRAQILSSRGQRRAGRNLLRAGIRRARTARQRQLEAALLLALAEFAYLSRRLRRKAGLEAKAACRKAIRLARVIRDPVSEVTALNRLGTLCWKANDVSGASNAFEQALQRLPRLGSVNRQLQCSVLLNVGNIRMEQNQPRSAVPAFRAALTLARKHGNRTQSETAVNALQALGVRVVLPVPTSDAAARDGPRIVLFAPSSEAASPESDARTAGADPKRSCESPRRFSAEESGVTAVSCAREEQTENSSTSIAAAILHHFPSVKGWTASGQFEGTLEEEPR